MKVYVVDYPEHAGKWIYRGYQNAWKALGYDVIVLNTGQTLTEMNAASLHDIDINEEYIIMYPDSLCNDEKTQEIISKSHKSFISIQPNAYPTPWGLHPNYRCHATDETIKALNGMENVHLWCFGDERRFHLKWKKSNTLPLAYDSVSYKQIIDQKNQYDICFVGGWVNNGLDEKRKVMVDIFTEFSKSNLKCGFFVDKNLTHKQENVILSNSKVCLNIHDVYQRVLGHDTNERTFKSLGLNGALVSDTVGQLSRIFPEVKTSLEAKELVGITKMWLSLGEKELEDIKETNRGFIESTHCYTNRVEKMLSLPPADPIPVGVCDKDLSLFDPEALKVLNSSDWIPIGYKDRFKPTFEKAKKIIYIDIDETICESPEDRDYTLATPIQENIDKANKLFDEGNTVIYWTARGTKSGIDWEETTREQFEKWGVKFHDLQFGKPYYDLFIDDKNMNTGDWK